MNNNQKNMFLLPVLTLLLLLSACGKQKKAEGEEPTPATEKGVVYETVILKPVPTATPSPTVSAPPTVSAAPTAPPETAAPAEPTPTKAPVSEAYETELLQ